MDSPSLGICWVEMQRAVMHVLGIQVGDSRGTCCRFHDWAPLGQAAFPALLRNTHTQLLSFLLTELFFLILIPGGFKAKITVKGKSES